jgi:acyl-CoA thioester hydrolase
VEANGGGDRRGRALDVTTDGSPIYSKHFEVPADTIDQQGHVSNLAYVTWMQDVAIEHSAAAGWPMDRYLALGAGWVVRSHFIEYLRPAFAGDRLGLHTWVPRFDQRSTPRRYLFVREPDHRVVADAETRWVFVDLTSGRRRQLPPDLLGAFEPVPDEPTVRRILGVSR